MKIAAIMHELLCAYFLLILSVNAQPATSGGALTYAPGATPLTAPQASVPAATLFTAPATELAPIAAGSTIDPAQAQPVINPISDYTTIIWQAAEQNKEITAITTNLFDTAGSGAPPWFLRLLNAFLTEIGSLAAKWIHGFVVYWEAPAASTLALIIQQGVFNPNVAASSSGSGIDNIVLQVRNLNVLMYVIAQDLLLLIFILAVWKTWANSTWHSGGGSLAGPVLRLCFTAALLLSWPTISAFIIQISNEMIKAIYPASGTADAVQLAKALESIIDLGVDASGAALIAMLSPLAATMLGASWFGTAGVAAGNIAGQSISFVAMLIFTVLASALICQLIYIVTMQSAQTVLLYAQYIFAPFFLLFFAHPDTETIATRYIHAVVEASLWSFIWVGLLRLLVIFMTSPFNVWGQVLYAIAVFQLMINTPQFIAKAHISPLSDFVSAGLFSNRTVTLIRSYSRQARQLGVRAGKALVEESGAGSKGTHKKPGTRSGSTSRSKVSADASEILTGQPLDSSWPSSPEASSTVKPKRKRAAKPKMASTDDVSPSVAGTTSAINPGLNYTSASKFNSKLQGLVHEPLDAGSITGSVAPQSHTFALQSNSTSMEQAQSLSNESQADPLTSVYDVQLNRLSRSVPPDMRQKSTPVLAELVSNTEPVPVAYGNVGSQIVCNGAGNFKIKVAPGTQPEELSRLHSIVKLAKLAQQDPQAHRAALTANAISYDVAGGSSSSQTEAQERPQAPAAKSGLSVIKHAVLGAQSFVDNEPGNGYCTYLEHRFNSHTPSLLRDINISDINKIPPPHINTGSAGINQSAHKPMEIQI